MPLPPPPLPPPPLPFLSLSIRCWTIFFIKASTLKLNRNSRLLLLIRFLLMLLKVYVFDLNSLCIFYEENEMCYVKTLNTEQPTRLFQTIYPEVECTAHSYTQRHYDAVRKSRFCETKKIYKTQFTSNFTSNFDINDGLYFSFECII